MQKGLKVSLTLQIKVAQESKEDGKGNKRRNFSLTLDV
jgi:hypothetical protein